MQFLYAPLAWGFLLIGVPILVHLINMLRHRQVKWAAMDFLLESHRRNRRWIMLKQWLLLAARMLAMFLLVLMLAKWVSNSQWLGLLGGRPTHHYVLLDDSYSMAAVDQDGSAYQRALASLNALVSGISQRSGQHQISLLRFSRASILQLAQQQQQGLGEAADLFAISIPRDPSGLLDRINATRPTALQLSPDDALDLISPLVVDGAEELSNLYILSDLRRNEFGEPVSTAAKLEALGENVSQIQLIDCGGQTPGNLSLASIEPEKEVWAAGVPLMVRFQVRNHGAQLAKNVVVKVRAISYDEGEAVPQPDAEFSGAPFELPPIVIEQIGAGETVTRQVQVIFSSPGQHVVEVTLPEDSLSVDNRSWCVIGIRQTQKLLLIDGTVDASNAFFFQTIANPSAQVRTGFSVEVADAAFLRDAQPEALLQYDVIGLLDVPRMDSQAIAAVEDFCRRGRGVLFLAGPNTNVQYTNEELYREGRGIYPLELTGIEEFVRSGAGQPAQVEALSHPILQPLAQMTNAPFGQVQIRKFLRAAASPQQSSGGEPVALGPTGLPFIFDRQFELGHSVAILTGFDPQWSNWAQDPTVVVLVLRTLGYLASFRHDATSQLVGAPLEMSVTGQTLMPDADILLPSDGLPRMRIQKSVDATAAEQTDLVASSITLRASLDPAERDLLDALLRPGLFETWVINTQGDKLLNNRAHNVVASEGDLDRVTTAELEQKLAATPVEILSAEALQSDALSSQDSSPSLVLLLLLCVLLIVEQLLAYSASYHPRRAIGAA